MTQEERLSFLIRFLLAEDPSYAGFPIPGTVSEQRRLLRGLLNVRPPKPISNDFLEIQDAYLQERLSERGVQSAADLAPLQPGLFVWQGDITTLRCDAIVNAANSQMLGCFVPCHGCIDNVRRGAAAPGMCRNHAAAGARGGNRAGEAHEGV